MMIKDELLKKFSAIEVDSSKFKSENENVMARALAERLGIPAVTASDSHYARAAGLWYIETPEFKTLGEFVRILKNKEWKDVLTEERLKHQEEKRREILDKGNDLLRKDEEKKEKKRRHTLKNAEEILEKCQKNLEKKKCRWKFW